MTVAINDALTPFLGDGVTKVFTYDFPITVVGDMKVLLDGQIVEASEYTVSLTPKTVTFTVAPADGAKGGLFRDTAVEQDIVYSRVNSSMNVEALAEQLDKIVLKVQENAREVSFAIKTDYQEARTRFTGDFVEGDTVKADGAGNFIPGANADQLEGFKDAAANSAAAAAASEVQTGLDRDQTGLDRVATGESAAAAAASAASIDPASLVFKVATHTAMKALSGTTHSVVYLTEAGRAGHFQWDSSDLSASITIDTEEGVYVAPTSDTTGASGAWVRVTEGKIFAEWFGAKGDASTVNTSAIQAAINYVSAGASAAPPTAPAYLDFGPGTFVTGPLTTRNRVILRGAGVAVTELFLANGSNADFISSEDFATLTGTNAWLTGLPAYLGFANIRVNGNKANQTAGDALKLYAKFLIFEGDVQVLNAYGVGIFSEAGDGAGVSSWPTFPEGRTGNLMISGCGSHGWQMRGPHDLLGLSATILINGGDGLRMEWVSGSYQGTADFVFLHSYANTGRGLYSKGGQCNASLLRLEDNKKEGLYLEGSRNNNFGVVQLFDNCITSGDFQGVIDSDSQFNQIGTLKVRNVGRTAAGGFQCAGDNNHIDGAIYGNVAIGGWSAGVGFDLASTASGNVVDIVVQGFLGTGGIGVRTNNGGASSYNQLRATITNCTTLWSNPNAGIVNNFNIIGNCASTLTKFSGVGPAIGVSSERWDVILRDSTPSIVTSAASIIKTIALDSATKQTLTVDHGLVVKPNTNSIQAAIAGGTVDDFVVDYIRVVSATSTQITIDVKLGTASATAGATANLNITAHV